MEVLLSIFFFIVECVFDVLFIWKKIMISVIWYGENIFPVSVHVYYFHPEFFLCECTCFYLLNCTLYCTFPILLNCN